MTKTLMAVIVLSTILTTPVYANDICNGRKDIMTITMALRQDGHSFKDSTKMVNNLFNKLKKNNPSVPDSGHKEVLDYAMFSLKNAFKVPIQNDPKRRQEIIDRFAQAAYDGCMAQISGGR